MEELKSKDNQLEELRSQLAETDDVVAGLEKVNNNFLKIILDKLLGARLLLRQAQED